MKLNESSIPVSHGGNLPRPDDFDALLLQGEAQREAITRDLPSAVANVVERQVDCGVTIVNDGEYVKASAGGNYGSYVYSRLEGFSTLPVDPNRPPKRMGAGGRDQLEYPAVYDSGIWFAGAGIPIRPAFMTPGPPPVSTTERVCTGPVRYVGQEAIAADIDALKTALRGKPVDGFIAALGPLSTGAGHRNEYYDSEESYLVAVAEAIREEYRAITDAGLILQMDEPEFLTAWMFYPDWSVDEYRKYLEFCVEIINHSLEGIPEDQIRYHACWGSAHRPHTNDIELKHLADLIVKINAQVYSIESSNVRHEHEWPVWAGVKIPDGRKLMPGVVGHASDLIEHPELVARRLVNFASVVGRENLEAGTDCGIGSRVGHQDLAWAKLRALADGAALASAELWPTATII